MKICEAGRSTSCCRNPDIRSINTMGADTAGNFEIRAGNSVNITTETNGIRIAYTGGLTTYDNTDGNIVIDNDLFTINLADDITITGDMIIAGDLTVNGTYYTVHAEHVYTQDDYIILREGATTPLAAGSYAGFQVTKYDGTNDGRLVVDNAGVARVGDVGDEQPLLTRDEAADLTDGDSLVWDAANSKAVTQAIPTAIGTALADKVNVNDLFFKSGDTYNAGSSMIYYGFVSSANAIFMNINLPKLLDRAFTLTIDSINVYTPSGSFSSSTNPVSSISVNNQTFDTIRVNVTFTNNHGQTTDRPCTGFVTYTITIS